MKLGRTLAIWLASLAFAGVGAVLVVMQGTGIDWVGSADVDSEFRIIDARTRLPIPHATISIMDCFAERPEVEALLQVDTKGTVRHLWKECVTSGRKTALRFTDTYHAGADYHLVFQVTAYDHTESGWLRVRFQDVKRVAPGKARAVIEVPLQPVEKPGPMTRQ